MVKMILGGTGRTGVVYLISGSIRAIWGSRVKNLHAFDLLNCLTVLILVSYTSITVCRDQN